MARISGKIIASAVLLFVILSIETVERIKVSPDFRILDSNFYIIATFVSTMMYLIILYMFVNRFRNQRTRVAVLCVSLSLIVVILPIRFFLRPPRWDFDFRLIFTINKSAITVFLLINYLRDVRMKILSALFVSLVGLFVIHYTDPHRQQFNAIVTGSLCTVIYGICFWFYMRVKTEQIWKIMTVVFFIVGLFGILLTYVLCFRYSHWDALFYIVHATDMTLVITYPLYKNSYDLLQSDEDDILELTELPIRFTFENLLKATKNFRFRIGQGGSSTVYKGTLSDGSNVAVKRIKGPTSGEDEFKTEITILASLEHINLAHIIGYCLTSRGDRYLVYPFFENGSLDSWIFSGEEKRQCLTWNTRYQIAVDVAKALSYLHHHCRHQILHLDVKPGNILLDGEFQAKLSDFGISRAMNREDSNVMTRARGTFGYLSPEMLIPTAISTKSDVYSYGKVLLELVGGRRNFQLIVDGATLQQNKSYLPKVAKKKMLEGRLMEVVDPCLSNEHINEDEVRILVSVAFWCIQENPERRPSMADVVDMLEGNLEVHLMPDHLAYGMNCFELESNTDDTTQTVDNDETVHFSDDRISILIQ